MSHPLQSRYTIELRALKSACLNVICGCQRLVQACEEAENKGVHIRVENYETTITTGYRIVLKTLAVVLFMQSLGVRRPLPDDTHPVRFATNRRLSNGL